MITRRNAGVTATLALALMTTLPARGQSFEEQVAASKPLAPETGAMVVAGRKLSAEVCKVEGTQFLGKSESKLLQAIEATGGSLLVVDDEGVVTGLKLQPGDSCKLSLDKEFGEGGKLKLKDKVTTLSADDSGRVIASHGIFNIYGIKDGKEQFSCKTKGYVQLHDSGTWGIAPWVNSTVRIIEFGKFNCKKISDWVLQDLNDDSKRKGPFTNVNSAAVVGDVVLIGGILAKSEDPKSPRVVIAYDRDGKEQFRFGNTDKPFAEDRFGWVHAIDSCPVGLCVLDGNNKRLTLWGEDGEFYGAVDLKSLFGLSSAWTNDFTVSKDGHVYVVAAETRKDSKVAEGLIYRINGF